MANGDFIFAKGNIFKFNAIAPENAETGHYKKNSEMDWCLLSEILASLRLKALLGRKDR